jgi:hypothetical protein
MMSTPFDHIEGHLRNFIEQSIQLLPDSNRLHAQLLRLARSLQSRIKEHIEKEGSVPAAITLSFNPNNLPTWRDHPEIIEFLREAVQGLASDQGIATPVAPDIHLEPDASLPLDSFAIRQGAPSTDTGQTQAIVSSEGTDGESEAGEPDFFLIYEENRVFPLRDLAINIGRAPHNNLVIDDPRVSRLHAQVRIVDGVYAIFDLNSRGGTFVNGERIEQAALKPGDIISLAGYSVHYQDGPPQNSPHLSQTLPIPRP